MKIAFIFLIVMLLIGGVYSFNVKYSNPTYNDGHKIEWGESINERPIQENITRDEWNKLFDDYRNSDISKEEAIKIIRRVKVKW